MSLDEIANRLDAIVEESVEDPYDGEQVLVVTANFIHQLSSRMRQERADGIFH